MWCTFIIIWYDGYSRFNILYPSKKKVLSLTACPVFVFLLLEATNYSIIPYSEPVSVSLQTLIYPSAGLSAFIFIVFQVFFYQKESDNLTQKLQNSLKKESFLRKKQTEVLDKELEIAKQLQFGLMPQKPPHYDHFNIKVYYQPFHQIGGTYYDFIPYCHNEVLGVVSDIGGERIPASIMMIHFRNMVHKQKFKKSQ
jgi:hypothetical protein